MPLEEIKYLTHIARESSVAEIFQNGELRTSYDQWKHRKSKSRGAKYHIRDEFPGLYMAWHLGGESVKADTAMLGPVVMVFPRDLLLRQRNYHLNLCDKNGMFIEDGTFFGDDKGSVPDLAESRRAKSRAHNWFPDMNEVVFHDSVSFHLCTKIYCATRKTLAKVKAMAKESPHQWRGRCSLLPTKLPDRAVALPPRLREHLNTVARPCKVFFTDIWYTGVPCTIVHDNGRRRRTKSSIAYVRSVAARAGYDPADLAGMGSRDIERMLMEDGAYLRCFLNKDSPPAPPPRHTKRG